MKNISNIIVKINFEERQPVKVVNENSQFKVWVSSLINQDFYNTSIVTDLSFVKESDYEYTITADTLGFNTIEVFVNNKELLTSKSSNTLLAIVK